MRASGCEESADLALLECTTFHGALAAALVRPEARHRIALNHLLVEREVQDRFQHATNSVGAVTAAATVAHRTGNANSLGYSRKWAGARYRMGPR